MNLLIVDDDLTSLKLLRTQLESEGHAVFEAYDGVDALALLEHQRVDAVISDVLMPRLDGYRLCHEIRKHARLHDLPIIIYTSTYTSPGDEKLALDVGADKYLKKPISVATMIAALHEVIAVPHAARPSKALQQVDVPKEYSEKLVSKLKEKNTELQVQTEALRQSEERYRQLFESAPDAIFALAPTGVITSLNHAFETITGWPPAQWLGRPFQGIIYPGDQTRAGELFQLLLRGERAPPFEVRVRTAAGGFCDVELTGFSSQLSGGRIEVQGIGRDITERKQAEEEIRRYIEQLKTALMSTVEVATTLSEMRDPYTAGHERRVGNIAAAIGAELGLDERRQEGLRVAGYLHDIGKITIPAEILSKPSKLNPIELQLVQGHARASYDVLKGVEFPWPVAEVVLQHHERMDGSGYPQGLKGEAILLEARIMAVADVIEAMSSHRPYRPGLGIEAALSEIERGRGSVYDAEVADAALRLFRERHYQLAA